MTKIITRSLMATVIAQVAFTAISEQFSPFCILSLRINLGELAAWPVPGKPATALS